MPLLDVHNLGKIYQTRLGGKEVEALKSVEFSVDAGEFVAIMGESGSGKTTLLNILATLDKPTSGRVILAEKDLGKFKDSERSLFRRENLGFVFQDFNLLDNFSIEDNILLPLVLEGKKYNEMQKLLMPLVKKLSIEKLIKKYPYEVSGGQKQRVAVARALITNPSLLLADEPTGALDSKASKQLLEMFKEINDDGQTILMVTHSISAASYANHVLFIKDGCIKKELRNTNNLSNKEMYLQIEKNLNSLIIGE
nr:ABC transporter ATP-binding protein [uncultured Lachnoclostridium sp.]